MRGDDSGETGDWCKRDSSVKMRGTSSDRPIRESILRIKTPADNRGAHLMGGAHPRRDKTPRALCRSPSPICRPSAQRRDLSFGDDQNGEERNRGKLFGQKRR